MCNRAEEDKQRFSDEHKYRIGERIVHIPEGVCRIEEITKIDSVGEGKQYYKLVPLMGDTCALYVSVNGSKKNIRKLRSKEEMLKIVDAQKTSEMNWEKREDRRLSQVKAAIYNDDGVAIAKWIKVYYCRRKKERLNIVDNNLLKKAEQLLYSEMSVVLRRDYNKLRSNTLSEK